jgi:hypothetical protein
MYVHMGLVHIPFVVLAIQTKPWFFTLLRRTWSTRLDCELEVDPNLRY